MSVSLPPAKDLLSLLDLDEVKPDTFLGGSVPTTWGRIYGGQVIAQALRAAAFTVETPMLPHSIHAYFVREGDQSQPVVLEVTRIRDGRSFSTRQVVVSQRGGAILNAIASFHRPEADADVQVATMPQLRSPADVEMDEAELIHEHRTVSRERDPQPRFRSWLTIPGPLPDDPVIHACGLAFMSDDDVLGAALVSHPLGMGGWDKLMTASLDHALWFHRPFRADGQLLFDCEGLGVADARGLGIVRIFDESGVHVATAAQEGLGRTRR